MRLFLLISFSLLIISCGGGGGGGGNNDNNSQQPTERAANLDCIAPDYPAATDADIEVNPAFPSLPAIPRLVGLYQSPGDSDYWYAINQNGYVYRFANNPGSSSYDTFLDLSGQVYSGDYETGLLGLAFHPDYELNGWVFIYYMPTANSARLSRFTLNGAGTGLDIGTEKIILSFNQPATNHNGGGLAFGPDGFLYLSLGDGGLFNDVFGNGQDTMTIHGNVLRLDIDVADPTPYQIPADNPFADGVDGLPEIYAYGLRNPWRWSFDRVTGELWLGDVGQNEREEINIIENGGNYGWPIMEGIECFNTDSCDQSGLTLPVADYTHAATDGCSVTGGFVYRGQQFPEFYGHYFYGDYCSGKIYSLLPTGSGYQQEEKLDTTFSISAFAESNAGELFLLNLNGGIGGGIYSISAQTNTSSSEIPEQLSASGCFQQMDSQDPADGVIPYLVNSELWSDGANKARLFAIPDNSQFSLDENGDFIAPDGTVLVKHFYLDDRILETRLLMKHISGWAGYSYEWNETGTEALLLEDGKEVAISGDYTHIFPSRGQCLECHTSAAGFSLGLETLQLNHSGDNFLQRLETLGYLADALPGDALDQALASLDDEDASIEDRARSYLHSNCSMCHRPGGPIAAIDLRYNTALADTGLCQQVPNYGNLGVSGARLLLPGDSERSVLSLRMRDNGNFRMPPLASQLVDDDAVAIINQWINGLADCN